MNKMQPGIYYTEKLEMLQTRLSRQLQKNKSLGWLRLGTIIGLFVIIYILWSLGWMFVVMAGLLLLILFTRLVFADINNKAAITHTKELIRINKDELKAIEHNYHHFPNGAVFIPKDHLYANDLDLFGEASLFQYINRTSSQIGAS